jgi:hypothetical protein
VDVGVDPMLRQPQRSASVDQDREVSSSACMETSSAGTSPPQPAAKAMHSIANPILALNACMREE